MFFGYSYPAYIRLTFTGCGSLSGVYIVPYEPPPGGDEYQYVAGDVLVTVTADSAQMFNGFDTDSATGDSCFPPAQFWDGITPTLWDAYFGGAPGGTILIEPYTP